MIHANLYDNSLRIPVKSNGKDYFYNIILPDFLLFTATVTITFCLMVTLF